MSGLRPSATSYEVVCEGTVATIRLSGDVCTAYRTAIEGKDKISMRRKRHLERSFREFCEHHPPRLGHEKYKKEGDFPDGSHGHVAIWEFKAWQFRIYGASLKVGNKKCFVGVRYDPSKKQDQANQQLLKNAALDIGKLREYAT
jgi:hypothetical protein